MSSDEEECVEEAVQDQEEAMAEDVKQEPEQSEPAKRKQIFIINYSLLDVCYRSYLCTKLVNQSVTISVTYYTDYEEKYLHFPHRITKLT